jgi:hypothetical protein
MAVMKAWLKSIGIEPLPAEARRPMLIFFLGFAAMVLLLSAAAKLNGG